jgi:hypothetical protein
MPTVVLSKLTQRWWKDENPTVSLSNLTRRRRGTENQTVVMPYLAQRQLKNGNSTVALPTLILRWFNVVTPMPTITTFYRRWFDVTLQTGNTMHSSTSINILAIYNVISGSACDILSLINYIFFITPLLCANLFGMTEHVWCMQQTFLE